MKKLLVAVAIMAFTTLGASADQLLGIIFNNAVTPGGGYTATAANKIGTTSCKSIFFIVGVGDCSVRTAMKNGGIKSIAGYDVARHNILGFQTITVKAWGN